MVAPRTPDSTTVDVVRWSRCVRAELQAFLDLQERDSGTPHLRPLLSLVRDFCARGGKMLRPTFVLCGWHAAAAPSADPVPAYRWAAALELFHAFALIHDDVMDDSAIRRGGPTVHRMVTTALAPSTPGAAVERIGVNTAILLGDLCLVWSDALMQASGFTSTALAATRPLLDAMRAELIAGQFLDLLGELTPPAAADIATALTTARYKTAKYTVERPLQLGAVLAGGSPGLLGVLSGYGVPIGEAFQLRDDVLGVFGEPAVTGKSNAEDLRSGKRSTLLALAYARADDAQRRTLDRFVGAPDLDDDGAAAVRDAISSCGALAAAEDMIDERRVRALDALSGAGIPTPVDNALRSLADLATNRKS